VYSENVNIVHLLSQNQLTGAEVYACQIISEQIKQHNVYQISNGFYTRTSAEKIELPVETKSFFSFIKSVITLKNILKDKNIQIIHSHSRAAAKLAFWSTLGTQVAHVSTIHGRQHFSFSKRLVNHYGQFQIPVCENIQTQLINEFKYKTEKVKLVRNAIDERKFAYQIKNKFINSDQLHIGIIGRLTGPKKDRTLNFIKQLCEVSSECYSQFIIDIVGAEQLTLNFKIPESIKVKYISHAEINSDFYHQYDVIIGSGRVCIEALFSGVPTIAFGEAQYLGLVKIENYSHFLFSNFGDISTKSFGAPLVNDHDLQNDLNSLKTITLQEINKLSQMALLDFQLLKINKKIMKIYEMAYLEKIYSRWIPVLMYHKIPDQNLNSQHKIFVTTSNFEKHLKFYKNNGFQTLTFNDLLDFSKGLKPISDFPKKPLLLTFDDGYEDNLKNAAPLLIKYGFKAQVFLLAHNEVSYNSWDEQNEIHGDKIISGPDRFKWNHSPFEIGSHGLKHDRITQMSEKAALYELIESKRLLEHEFKTPVHVFAYTFGDTSEQAAKLAEIAGYEFAVNTDTGGLAITENPYQIFRVNIFPNETSLSLWKKTSWWYRRYYFFKRKK